MGIRFYCPSGHKLNVKEHLAGKVGFCPECGTRLTIPLVSNRKSSRDVILESQEDAPIPLEWTGAEVPMAVTSSDADLAPAQVGSAKIHGVLADQSVTWYIQIPGESQYGPITGQVLQSWLHEQRIGPYTLLWREGWTGWLEAKEVFPELEHRDDG